MNLTARLLLVAIQAAPVLTIAAEHPEEPSMSTFHKPPDDELRKRPTREQYEVTQHEATERPFQNAYWDHHGAGIFVDVVSGEPLFSPLDKFDSGTGWPSFTQPLEAGHVNTKTDWRGS
ncbi:MAG TPA: peptide-methionine (R)-S-oxide reductase [Anaeromyxobacteraceae bacterium]|nr:peptide-methionine (R)-S-oxide reductase [Anaeromyxobacteraceae bacterium]